MQTKKIDIVYVVGDGTATSDNSELKFSLRSIAQFAKDIGRVIVVGTNPPEWLSSEVLTLKVPDIPNKRKHFNIINCLNEAVKHFNITAPFMYSSDDHFLCRPTVLADIPVYCRMQANNEGFVYNEEQRKKIYGVRNPNATKYQTCLLQTRSVLEKEGLMPFWTCWHGNTWIYPDVIQAAFDFMMKHQNEVNSLGFEPTVLITALKAKKETDDGKEFHMSAFRMRDPKIANVTTLMRIAYENGCFSCTDTNWLSAEFRAFMTGLFFLPCRYENESSLIREGCDAGKHDKIIR